MVGPTADARRRIHESLRERFTAFYQGLSPEEQQALAAILQQAAHQLDVSGFGRSGAGIGALVTACASRVEPVAQRPTLRQQLEMTRPPSASEA
jgi:hypothetical protein